MLRLSNFLDVPRSRETALVPQSARCDANITVLQCNGIESDLNEEVARTFPTSSGSK